MLTYDEGCFLVRIARTAIITYLKSNKKIQPPMQIPKILMCNCGVFVILNQFQSNSRRNIIEVRGAVGNLLPTKPLVNATIECAIDAAVHDSRFSPIRVDEIGNILVEVNVVTLPELIHVDNATDYFREFKIPGDGMVVENGVRMGVLLPQVAKSKKFSKEEFLVACCKKAKLPADSWLLKDTRVYKFQAEVFKEIEPGGRILHE